MHPQRVSFLQFEVFSDVELPMEILKVHFVEPDLRFNSQTFPPHELQEIPKNLVDV